LQGLLIILRRILRFSVGAGQVAEAVQSGYALLGVLGYLGRCQRVG
jgi:hypothetical protein